MPLPKQARPKADTYFTLMPDDFTCQRWAMGFWVGKGLIWQTSIIIDCCPLIFNLYFSLKFIKIRIQIYYNLFLLHFIQLFIHSLVTFIIFDQLSDESTVCQRKQLRTLKQRKRKVELFRTFSLGSLGKSLESSLESQFKLLQLALDTSFVNLNLCEKTLFITHHFFTISPRC